MAEPSANDPRPKAMRLAEIDRLALQHSQRFLHGLRVGHLSGGAIVQARMDGMKHLQAETAAELEALLPSVLDQAFRGEL